MKTEEFLANYKQNQKRLDELVILLEHEAKKVHVCILTDVNCHKDFMAKRLEQNMDEMIKIASYLRDAATLLGFNRVDKMLEFVKEYRSELENEN